MTREQIRDALWPNTFVDYERSLNRTVAKLRSRLNDDPERPQYIETIPGRGYRFIAPIVLPITEEKSVVAVPPSPQPNPLLTAGFGERISISSTGSKRVKWGVWVTALAITSATLGYAFFRSHKTLSRLTFPKGTIVVADFQNRTGDPVFDDTLKTGLDVSLRQSPFISVLSEKKVADSLQLMARPVDTPLTPEVARDICQRQGSSAYLAGSISKLGSAYVLALKTVNCQSGEILAQQQAKAEAKEKVLDALDQAASNLRSELGETLATLQKFNVPLERATTKSLDALHLYTRGLSALRQRGDLAAIPLFQHATELDPNFALAYSHLGSCYDNTGRSSIAEEYYRKAFALSDHTSEPEKLGLAADYYSSVTGQINRSIDIGEVWAHTYPNDREPHGLLSANYMWIGAYEKALSHTNLVLEKEPKDFDAMANLLGIFLALNRFAEAEGVAEKMRALAPDVPHYYIYRLGFVREDQDEMRHQEALARIKGDLQIGSAIGDTAAYHGRIVASSLAGAASADPEPQALSLGMKALWEAEFGFKKPAIRDATQSVADAPSNPVRTLAALASTCRGHRRSRTHQ